MRAGRPMRLTEMQIQSLAKDMVRSPEEFGYDQAIWDGALLGHHLENTFHVTLGVRQCQRIFHHLGMRLLRPRTSPKGADADAQAAF
jgi:transposase